MYELLCSNTQIPERFGVSQHMGLMVATQLCDLCNPHLVQAGELVGVSPFSPGATLSCALRVLGSVRAPAAL